MLLLKEKTRFADAEDEDSYQSKRENPIFREPSSCSLKGQEIEESQNVRFDPPLYIQRYAKVVEFCTSYQFRTVADFGANELVFTQYLKNLEFMNQIYAVDIDIEVLERHKLKCKPLMLDHMNKRSNPLNISVLCGSVLEFDQRLKGLDCIVCLELIEHLEPSKLDQFSRNVFGQLLPNYVIITTPNKDFNELFAFKSTQMRHWDHKFEWTRDQFRDYCEKICTNYCYRYSIFGVGDPPPGHEDLGFCTQGALLTFNEDLPRSSGLCESNFEKEHHSQYVEVYTVDYPVADHSLTSDDHLKIELEYQSRAMALQEYLNMGDDFSEIPIETLQTLSVISQYSVSDSHIADLVEKSDSMKLSEDRLRIVVKNEPDSPVELTDSQSDASDSVENEVQINACDEEDW